MAKSKSSTGPANKDDDTLEACWDCSLSAGSQRVAQRFQKVQPCTAPEYTNTISRAGKPKSEDDSWAQQKKKSSKQGLRVCRPSPACTNVLEAHGSFTDPSNTRALRCFLPNPPSHLLKDKTGLQARGSGQLFSISSSESSIRSPQRLCLKQQHLKLTQHHVMP